MPVTVDPTTGIGTVQNVTESFSDGSTASISNLTLQPDPQIIFGIGATTGANPAVFSFGFSDPLSPGLNGSINASSSIGYTLTETGTGGVTLTPFNGANTLVANDFFPSTNKGVDVGPTGTGGTGVCGAFVGGTSNCGPFAAMNTFNSGGNTFTLMGATVSFVLSANSGAGLSGRVTQTLVPEPSTLTLLMVGMGLFAAVGRRRSRI